MDEIKSKLLNFVKKQSTQIKEDIVSDISDKELIKHECFSIQRSLTEVDDKLDESQVVEDEKILEDIDSIYFNVDDVDIKMYELKKLPDVLNCKDLRSGLKLLYRQHSVVSKKLLRLILEQENKCKKEFDEILRIKGEVSTAIDYCKNGRLHIHQASDQFTLTSLGILANYKRKSTITDLLKSLKTLKTLQQTDLRLQELLVENNFPGAINLLQECQLVASHFNHFKCVAQLNSKLNDTLYMTKEQLDVALSQICKKFNVETYSGLQEAYRLLDDTETVMDQLLMHFTSEIHNIVFNTVHKYSNPTLKGQFQQICKNISTVCFIPCLQNLCQNLWHILNSYYQIVQWHQNKSKEMVKTGIPAQDVKLSLSKQHVKQKLENGLMRLWNDVQSRICIYLSSHNLADYKFEELLQILGIIHKLMEVGEEFCNSKSEELQNSVRQQSINYFKNYHHSKLEELRIFLENESWTLCPVRTKFNLLYLQEFKSLRKQIESCRKHRKDKPENLPDNQSSVTDGSSTLNNNYFYKYQDIPETPFDVIVEDNIGENILDEIGDEISGYFTESSEDSENDELKKDFVEETPTPHMTHHKKNKKKVTEGDKSPLLANTSLTVLRHCGKYLQMSKLLKTIALDVILCMCQLFEYYFYNIYLFFTKDLQVQSRSMFSFRMTTCLNKIKESLILDETIEPVKGKMVASSISTMVDLNRTANMHGLYERIIGVESLIFLSAQFEYIQPYILYLIPEQKRHFLQQFFSQTVTCVEDLRRPAYMGVSANIIDMKFIIKEMSKVDFEVKDVVSEHSSYVDQILRELQIFSMKLEEVDVHIPIEVYNTLWENVIHIVNNVFVDGFSNVKKCSNGGRALMQLDYTQFLSKLEKLTTLRPIPNKEFVDMYVKAYYLQEPHLEDWINQHREYTSKQLEALIHCSCQNNRKRRLKLLSILEVSEK